MGSSWYTTYHHLLHAIVPIALPMTVHGITHIPATGPALLVVNHLSNADPFCLIAAIPRHFHGFAKTELFDPWWQRQLITPLEPIKVHRQGIDRQALREAEDYLRRGELVCIFAEGTRSKTGQLQEARAGAVFLAHRTAVPIVPIAISGTHNVFRRQFPWYRRVSVQITVGQPFSLAEIGTLTRHNRNELAQAVMARVAALLPPGHQGIFKDIHPPPANLDQSRLAQSPDLDAHSRPTHMP